MKRVERFFELFADKCLIICNGLDKHVGGSNDDVRKIIEGRKLLRSNIIDLLRSHSTENNARYFPNHVVRNDGFSKDHAENL